MSTTHDGFTPGPWTFSHFLKPDGQPIQTVDDVCDAMTMSARHSGRAELFGASLDDDDGTGATVICYTGNGPCAHNNARLIADAPRLYAENQRLREALEWDRVLFARFAKGEGTPENAQHAWLRVGDALTEPDA